MFWSFNNQGTEFVLPFLLSGDDLLAMSSVFIDAVTNAGIVDVQIEEVKLENNLQQYDPEFLHQLWSAVLCNDIKQGLKKKTLAIPHYHDSAPFPLPVSLTEKLRQDLIHSLEKFTNPVADYVCGSLLLAATKDAPQDNPVYAEKCLEDAISFFLQASKDPKLKTAVTTRLWEIKFIKNFARCGLEIYPGIAERLDQFKLTPAVESYANFSQAAVEEGGKLPFPSFVFFCPPRVENKDQTNEPPSISLRPIR